MKERTITLACGALCALVFVSALFTPGQARGAVLDKPADVFYLYNESLLPDNAAIPRHSLIYVA